MFFNFLEISLHENLVHQIFDQVGKDLREDTDNENVLREQHEVAVPKSIRKVCNVGVDELKRNHLGNQAILV